MQKQIKKITDVLKNETAYLMIVVAMCWAFLIGIIVEKGYTKNKILDMQSECVKRRVADFYYSENGNIEFRWINK